MTTVEEHEQDHIDRFIATLRDRLPDLDLEVEAIVDRINGIRRRIKRDLDATLAEHGLTSGEWHLLGALHHEGDPYCSSPGALAAKLELSSGATTNRIDRLEERGLVRRRPDPADRRGVQVELTEKGRVKWQDAVNAQAQKEAIIAGALTREEQQQLNGLLRKVMLGYERRSPKDKGKY